MCEPQPACQHSKQTKSVSFNLLETCPARGPLDRSTRSLDEVEVQEPDEAWKEALRRPASFDIGLCWSTPRGPGSKTVCPCCSIEVSDDLENVAAACNNRRWSWSGEPPFCCLCASLKGLGRLRHFGCDSCKVRRTKYYKKRSWPAFNSKCRHCSRPREEHQHSETHAYPRCPSTANV